MAITLVTGPANAGKAQVVLDGVRAQLARGEEPLLVLPTRADAEHYMRELAGESAVLGVRVERFAGLISEAVRRAGVPDALLGEHARERVLQALAARAPGIPATPGLVSALGDLFAELQVRRVGAPRFAAALAALARSDAGGAPREWLGRLYSQYLRALERAGRADSEQRAVRALDALRERPALWRGTPVSFYGFDDLTRLQLDAIETLGRVVGAEVTVSLAYEPGRAAFAGRAASFQALAPLAAAHRPLAARAEHYEAPSRAPLSHLERGLFEPGTARVPAHGAVRLLQAGGERAELELVAAEVAELLERGLAPHDIAVLMREPGAGLELAREVFAAAGVPLALVHRRRLAETGIGRAVLGLLRCVPAADGSPRGQAADLLAWLRAPGLLERPGLADSLEREARTGGVLDAAAARALWERRNWPLQVIDRLADAQASGPVALLDRVERELGVLLAAPRRGTASVLAEGELDEAAAVVAARLALGELRELASTAPDLAAADADALAACLQRVTFRAGRAPGPGAVTLADPLALRARRVRALFVCGMQEGAFPAPPRPQPLLSDEQRRELARGSGLLLEQTPDALASERYLLYAAVSRPERLLALSWRVSDDEGSPASRSLFVDDVCDLFDARLSEDRRRRALGAVDGHAGPGATPAPAPGPQRLRDERLLAAMRERVWSASSLESWIGCPVRWYVEKLLHPGLLEPDPEPLARGGLAHAALRDTLDGLRRETGSARVTPATLPAARRLLGAALTANAAGYQLSSTPVRAAAISRRLALDLDRFLQRSAAQECALEPAELELGFGFDAEDERGEGSTLPALDLGEGLRLRGRVDRIDVTPAGEAVVIDYKGSSAAPAARWLCDHAIQVALYMLVVERLLGRHVVAGLYQPLTGHMRPRGVIDRDARLELDCVSTDLHEADVIRELVAGAVRLAREAAGEAARGELAPRPETCAFGGGCSYPTICRCER